MTIFSWLRDQYAEFAAALRFLSIIPLPGQWQQIGLEGEGQTTRLLLGSAYFPLVGALLALLLSILLLVDSFLPQLVFAALLVILLVVLTGGLHLDGLMDTCDGLLGGRTVERRLEIMRDSRVGSFGVLGGVCMLLLKFALFASIGHHALLPVLLIALPSARWSMVLALRLFPSARPTGLGVIFRQSVTPSALAFAGISSALIAILVGRLAGLLAWGLATLLALALGSWITRRINGLTGDTYGAIEEVTETVLLLLLVVVHF